MIKRCNCIHKYQDKKYGTKMRVHNESKSVRQGARAHTCTVCGTKKD